MREESDYFSEIGDFYKERPDRFSVLDVKSEIGMERFVRSFGLDDLIGVFPYTSIMFEGFDVNWYEEGNYQTGLLRISLFRHLEGLFREANLLKDDERLSPVCHYSEDPGKGWLFPFYNEGDLSRPNLVIGVHGGEYDDDGKYLCCILGERRFFEIVDDLEYVREACQGAVG